MHLDRMLGMEGEDGGGEETAFQENVNGDTDHQRAALCYFSFIVENIR